MFRNYLLIAIRHIFKNKLYSAINILGLIVGLTVYLFGSLLTEYELTHDTFFEKSERIFSVGSVFGPEAKLGILSIDSANSALGPIIKAEVPELATLSRSIRRQFLLSIDDNDYYQFMEFVDSDFTRIFDFTYIEGNETALDDRTGLLITQSAAYKYFGKGPALGKSLTLDHDKVLSVTGVIADLPMNTHFNSSLAQPGKLEMVAHISVLTTENRNEEEGNWSSLNLGDLTYFLAPDNVSQDWIQTKMDGLYESHFPSKDDNFVSGFKVRPLIEANTFLWSAIGMPIVESVHILAILVLVVAIVNYTNLATAQSLRRTREVGLRKTMGADRSQLLTQFLVESVLITTIAMIISIAILEFALPLFNGAVGKDLTIDYGETILWILTTAIVVGLVAGAYPAYLITKTSPIHALRDTVSKSTKGGIFRSIMLGIQFAISIFMMAIVMVIYFQNSKLEEAGNIYPRSQIVTLTRLGLPDIRSQYDVLRNEIESIPGVTGLAYSSQVPFEQSNSNWEISAVKGDELNRIAPNIIWTSPNFFEIYDTPLLKGRILDESISGDTIKEGVYTANVIVNEMLLKKLGYTLDSVNPVFHELTEDRQPRTYSIVGVVPDQNILGFHNQIKPFVFPMMPEAFDVASIRIQGRGMQATIKDIEDKWKDIIPDYPIQVEFLDETFNDVFNIFGGITKTMAAFAFLAMLLSMVGLFGLAAFMVERRTREIGIRKVMGANLGQIVRLLIWQFSKPVVWAAFVALPASYFAADTYLNFFSDRLPLPEAVIAIAGVLAVGLSWAIVSVHAMKVARANPIRALRYE